MIELSNKVEAATAPSRGLDCEIGVAIGWFSKRKGSRADPFDYVDVRQHGNEKWPGYGGDQLIPEFTRDMDAAMLLIPTGWFGEVTFGKNIHGQGKQAASMQAANGAKVYTALGSTHALAICAASLRARAASQSPQVGAKERQDG